MTIRDVLSILTSHWTCRFTSMHATWPHSVRRWETSVLADFEEEQTDHYFVVD